MNRWAKRVISGFGILAGVALAGGLLFTGWALFSSQIDRSRARQAVQQMNMMWAGSITYYETEHLDATGRPLPRQFPGPSAQPESAKPCGCMPRGCSGGNAVWKTDPVWRALRFRETQAHVFMPGYVSNGTGTSARFTAFSTADADCDGVLAEFSRTGYIDAEGKVAGSYVPQVKNELE
jgi:hypothetical protein